MDLPTSEPAHVLAPRCSHGRTGPSLGSSRFCWPAHCSPGQIAAVAAEPMTAQDALRDLRGFRVLGSVLYVAAHPDDENTQLIAYLARGRAYRTAYLSLTRGDGGQNVIGPEIFEELGVIRTQELLAARRLDGGRQFFTRAIDFGFSKSPAETLKIWDRTAVVSDIVRVIRTFRPDVIITRFSPARGRPRAPHRVGDPGRRGIQARRRPEGVPRADRRAGCLAAEADSPGRRRIRPQAAEEAAVPARCASRSAATTRSPASRSARSPGGAGRCTRARASATSEGAGRRRAEVAGGPRTSSFTLLGGEPATKDILDGVETTWARVPGGDEVAKLADQAVANFDLKDPAANVPALLAIRKRLAALPPDSHRGREAAPARPGDPGLPRARGRDDRSPGRSRTERGVALAALGEGQLGRARPLAGGVVPAGGPVDRRADRPDGRHVPPPARRNRGCPPARRWANLTGCATSTPSAFSRSIPPR